jgi:dephospho-CoA kinase
VAVARLVAQRGYAEADARSRIAAQISREERRHLVDLVPLGAVIDNSGDRAALDARIEEVWQLLSGGATA